MIRRCTVALLSTLALVCTACSATGGGIGERDTAADVPRPGGASELTEPPSAPAAPDCGDPTASLRPQGPPSPAAVPAHIRQRGKLIVGVDQNTYNMGFRNPFTGEIVGFDIDMAREIATAIFGTPTAIQLTVLTSQQRIPALKAGDVDIVIRTMSINCERLAEVDFSSVYYLAGQQVLVKNNSTVTGIESLSGKKVCATEGSTSLRNIANHPSKPIAVQVADWTDCLVMLQQNQVDAVSTDDTILAGLAAQDPFTKVVGDAFYAEPYGMAMPKGQTDFVRFVNGVLEQLRASGRWTQIYNQWLAPRLGTKSPPPATYRD